MTDIPLLKTHADPQLSSVAGSSTAPSPLSNGPPTLDGFVDDLDSSTIRCVCGYDDDDGETVFCEKCKTWQHVICYYPGIPVPDIHECVECVPRPLDKKGALERQRRLRELHNVGDRKVRRQAAKSSKKKAKDAGATVVQANGWCDASVDRRNGSPKDQQPPKRPKTSAHRNSTSVSNVGQTPMLSSSASRKRAASSVYNGQSPVKSPNSPLINGGSLLDYFSPEFFQLYRQHQPDQAEFTMVEANRYNNLQLTNNLVAWLTDPDALSEVTGKTPGDIFKRVESMEDLESAAPRITLRRDEDTTINIQGLYPIYKWLTVDADVPAGGYIGEIKGHIGAQADYLRDPANRWDGLRHPVPFVFFVPHLPICIDTRSEGTQLRYIRRSCQPNVKMDILIRNREYHFCLVAVDDIHADDEITIAWDVHQDIRQSLVTSLRNGNIRREGLQSVGPVAQWVSGVLANFGGCACSPAHDCLFARFDKRNPPFPIDLAPLKPPKTRKARKGQQASPLSTGQATNSRAGSEAINRDPDEEIVDSRSASGSSRSKPGSRDITPMTYVSADGIGLGVEMSDREKRKLLQQERLFEQLEMDQQHAQKRRRKTNTASTLATPVMANSKQLGPNGTASRKTSDSRAKSAGRANASRAPAVQSNGGPRRQARKPRPEYKEIAVQTDPDPDFPPLPEPEPQSPKRPPARVSYVRALLHRLQAEKEQRNKGRLELLKAVTEAEKESDGGKSGASTPSSSPERSPSLPAEVNAATASTPSRSEPDDVEMKDVSQTTPSQQPPMPSPPLDSTTNTPQPSHPPIPPGPPPWSSLSVSDSASPSKPSSLQIQLPSTPRFPATPPAASTPGSLMSGIASSSVAQSPSTLSSNVSLFSPSPASGMPKKKLSLSDYLKARENAAPKSNSGTQTAGNPAPIVPRMNGLAAAPIPPSSSTASIGSPSKDVKIQDTPPCTPASNAAPAMVQTSSKLDAKMPPPAWRPPG